MLQIVLTDEQLRVLKEARGPVEVRDPSGRPVASLRVLEAWEVQEIERIRNRPQGGRGIPSEQLQAHMQRLDEIRQSEGMDETKLRDLLRRMRAGEQV